MDSQQSNKNQTNHSNHKIQSSDIPDKATNNTVQTDILANNRHSPFLKIPMTTFILDDSRP